MKYLIVVLMLTSLVLAECDNDQIDINSASTNELEELAGIGEVKAQAIADERPFDSIDDLIGVYGIGEKTLEKIEEQGLACVEEESDVNEKGKEEAAQEVAPKIENYEIESVSLDAKNEEELIYISKSRATVKILPYVLCFILIAIIAVLIWQRF